MNATKKVIIDLDKSKSANKFGNDQLIHKPALEEVQKLINERLDNKQSIKDEDRMHETISILGSRGSGKSSLLLSIKNNLPNEISKDIAILRPIDPTLFESKQNILITLIALIQEEVNNIAKCNENDKEYFNWLESLRKLAEGLNALDGVGKNSFETDIWNDPQIILEKGLRQAFSEEQLETNLYNFINKSLTLLNKSFFLVLFDDIDTSFDKGEEVLETLRKYLRYPKIITMLAGDMDLFIKLIRRKNWPQFETLLKNNDYSREEIRSTIDHLEEQYLLKVLPSSSRIELLSLYDLLKQGYEYEFLYKENKYIKINSKDNDKRNLLNNLNTKFFKASSFNKFDKEYFIKAFLYLPIRTIVQFVRIYSDYFEERENLEQFLSKMLTLFSSLLHSFQISIFHPLLDNHLVLSELAILLAKNRKTIDIAESYRLKPIFFDNESNTLMLLLNIIINNSLDNYKANIFGYFIKVGLTRETLLSWPYENASESDFIRHIGLNENELPIKMTRRYCGFVYDMTTNRSYYNGYIKTYMHQEYLTGKTKLSSSEKESIPIAKYVSSLITKKKLDTKIPFKDDIVKTLNPNDATDEYFIYMQKLQENDVIFKKSILINTHITLSNKLHNITDKFLLNLLFMQVSSAYGSTNSYASVFPVIGLMSELMMKERDELDIFISNHIRTLAQIRTFVAFNGKPDKTKHSEAIEDMDEEEIEDETDSDVVFDDSDIIEEIKKWILELSNLSSSLPVHILAKIWTRFYYSLESIYTDKKNKHLGRIVSLQIAQFLNAWIVETMIYTQQKADVRLSNVVTAYDNFEYNFQKFKEKEQENEYLKLCAVVLGFPLWKYYLNEEIQNKLWGNDEKKHKIKLTTSKTKIIDFESFEPLLNTILIAKQR